MVTQKLGIRFLWIDALSILQDSPENWVIESVKMRDVYKGAIVAVAAASSSKVSEGIFRRRGHQNSSCRIPWKNGGKDHKYVSVRRASELKDTQLPYMAINRRTRKLQESLLAPRTLWLCDKQNMFECAEGRLDEVGRALTATENYRSKGFRQQISANRRHMRVSRLLQALKVPPVLSMPNVSSMERPQQVFTQGSLVSALNNE